MEILKPLWNRHIMNLLKTLRKNEGFIELDNTHTPRKSKHYLYTNQLSKINIWSMKVIYI